MRSRLRIAAGLLTLLSLSHVTFAQAPAKPRPGELPTDPQGKPLNFDFETGSLKDWTAEGDAFEKQPVRGDTVARRRGDMQSNHAGEFWVGTYEVNGDAPQGTLTSVPFEVRQPWASFLIAGGSEPTSCVEILQKDGGKLIVRASGSNTEDLRPVAVDLTKHVGQEIVVRLVDKSSGGWGHINFDDFRFHAEKPNYPQPEAPLQADVFAHSGLSPEEAAKAMTVPEGFSVSLFAGEPDVQQPIAMALDDRGRLWVAEAYSYPIRVPEDQARDRILIFEDVDGDGKFDSRKVFADNLNLVSGLAVGFGGVWVGAAQLPVYSGQERRRQTGRAARGAARRLGLPRHARNAERLHLGAGRLALRLPRRVYTLARRQAGDARRPASAPQRRDLAVPSHAAHVRSLCVRNQ